MYARINITNITTVMAEETGVCVLRCREGHTHGIVHLWDANYRGVPTRCCMEVSVRGLPPGRHGFHVHASGYSGVAGNDPEELCDHYNPTQQNHGGRGEVGAHAGDLGNLTADSNGAVSEFVCTSRFGLQEVFGRSLVVHAKEDDLGRGGDAESLRTGNSGGRILWGVIARLKRKTPTVVSNGTTGSQSQLRGPLRPFASGSR